MRNIELDLRCIATPRAAHIYIQYMLNLPAHYGRNLDALFDLMAREWDEDARVTLRLPKTPDEQMARFLGGLARVMRDAAAENAHLHIDIARG